MSNDNATLQRLEEQIDWYDRKSMHNQKWFKRLGIAEVLIALAIPLAGGVGAPTLVLSLLGAFIVLIRAWDTLNQHQHNWVVYRSTCEALKHEKYLWLAKAGVYSTADRPYALLAERVESLVSTEHAKWVAGRQKAHEQAGEAVPVAPAPQNQDH